MMRHGADFASEAALCAAFAEEMRRQGWTPYPETSGWDLLLVGHGMQVGVEAKLKPSIGVLAQLAGRMSSEYREHGPNHAIVLVARISEDFVSVARALGALTVWPSEARRWNEEKARVEWPVLLYHLEHAEPLHFSAPAWVPEVMPDVAAGLPSPIRLTAWKLSALRLLARLDLRGHVTVNDFRELGLHTSRWYHHWLMPDGAGRPQRWVRRPGVPLADGQHPEAFATVLEQERHSMRSGEPLAPPLRPLPLLDSLGT